MRVRLPQKKRIELAHETGLALKTIDRWCTGKAVTEANDRLLQRTASELGLMPENEVPHEEK